MATFTILSTNITLTKKDCTSYERVYNTVFEKAPADLAEKLATISEDELVDVMAQLLIDIQERLKITLL
jgi:hypothetical protein